MNFLSMVLAPTTIAQGEKFVKDERCGPEFSAGSTVNIPFCIAWNAPMDNTSLKYLLLSLFPPIEIDIMSTPSAMASSNAARMSTSLQLSYQHTL